MSQYVSAADIANRWGVSPQSVRAWAAAGLIDGAQKIGGSWTIPAGAQKPHQSAPGRPHTKSHNYRGYRIVPSYDVDPGHHGRPHQKWSIDMAGTESSHARYVHGFVSLADARGYIDKECARE